MSSLAIVEANPDVFSDRDAIPVRHVVRLLGIAESDHSPVMLRLSRALKDKMFKLPEMVGGREFDTLRINQKHLSAIDNLLLETGFITEAKKDMSQLQAKKYASKRVPFLKLEIAGETIVIADKRDCEVILRAALEENSNHQFREALIVRLENSIHKLESELANARRSATQLRHRITKITANSADSQSEERKTAPKLTLVPATAAPVVAKSDAVSAPKRPRGRPRKVIIEAPQFQPVMIPVQEKRVSLFGRLFGRSA